MKVYRDIDPIVSTTHDTCTVLMQYKNWGDALLLYFRYILQKKLQENESTYSEDSFMQASMWWWYDRLRAAKKVLEKHWFIETVQTRWENWKLWKKYVKVKYVIIIWTQPGVDPTLGNPRLGETQTNTLVVNTNTLVVKENTQWQDFYSSNNTNTPPIGGDNEKPRILSIQEKESLFNEFYSYYPHKVGKALARTSWMKIQSTPYEDIIKACRIFAKESKGKDIQYIKHCSTRLNQWCWEDYMPQSHKELKQELQDTFHWDVENRPDTAYGKNMKNKYEIACGEDWYDIRFEDKEEIKKEIEAKRKAYRLSHNGQDMPW